MLQFFRRYQKIFLVVVTFFIVVSFVFFGASSTFSQKNDEPNWEIGHLIDGSPLMSKKLYGMKRLTHGGLEEGSRGMNLLSGSFVHHEIVLTGQGELLASNYFDELLPELSEKWARIKQYVPYAHPYSPYISASSVWSQFAPEILDLLNQVALAPSEFSKEELPLMFQLYQAQSAFPAHMLHRILFFQERQTEEIRPDPGLPQAHLALFGFDSVEDWFGVKFTELASQFILNTACIAKEEGYKISSDEAKIDLYRNVQKGLAAYQQGNEITSEDVQKYYAHGIRSLGLTEKEAVALWQDVLLHKRFSGEVKGAVLIDRLALDQFKSSAKSIAQVEEYRLPRALQLTQFRQLLTLQCYLEAVSEGDNFFQYPKLRSVEEIKNESPELIVKSVDFEIATVTKAESAAKLTLKQTWNWEVQEENFERLQVAFPELGINAKETELERIEALEKLDKKTRFAVDQFARLALIEAEPQWIDQALAKAPITPQTLSIPLKGDTPFSGEHFLELIENRDPSLARYSQDGETFHQIHVLKHDEAFSLLSFEEANREGILDRMVNELLVKAYQKGSYKEPLEEVQEELARGLYPELLAQIEEVTGEKYSQLDDYAQHRFDGYLGVMRNLFLNHQKGEETPWSLEVVQREKVDLSSSIAVGEFSGVAEHGFFKLQGRQEGSASDEEMAMAKELLRKEAEKVWVESILSRISEHVVF